MTLGSGDQDVRRGEARRTVQAVCKLTGRANCEDLIEGGGAMLREQVVRETSHGEVQ